jgi:hypothetical protein
VKRLLWAATAVLLSSAAALVWFTMRIGPVVVIVSHRHDHALHLGDVLIGLPLALAALVSLVVSLPSARRPSSVGTRP